MLTALSFQIFLTGNNLYTNFYLLPEVYGRQMNKLLTAAIL